MVRCTGNLLLIEKLKTRSLWLGFFGRFVCCIDSSSGCDKLVCLTFPNKGFKSKAIIVLRTREAHAPPIPLEVCMDPLLEFSLFGRWL